jgi:hypothetical protein
MSKGKEMTYCNFVTFLKLKYFIILQKHLEFGIVQEDKF